MTCISICRAMLLRGSTHYCVITPRAGGGRVPSADCNSLAQNAADVGANFTSTLKMLQFITVLL